MNPLRQPQDLEDECLSLLSARRVSLIGEVAWEEQLVADLERTWAAVVDQKGARWGADHFPVSLAVHLVTVANRTYEYGDLWGAFPHFSVNTQRIAGESFERTLRMRALERFPQFAHEGALRFAAPILAHGGIPQPLAGTFLRRLLLPALRNAEGSTAEELIGRWRASNPVGIPRPVLRFLRHGGATALDFVARCIELTEMDREQLRRDPSAAGLPRRVVEAFLEVPAGEVVPPSRQTRATITLDPWDERGPVARLPPVGRELAAGLTWIVEDETRRDYEASPHTERQVQLSPADHWRITAAREGERQRPMRVEALAATGIICFDEGGGFIPDERGLRAEHLWVVIATSADLVSIEGELVREVAPLEDAATLRGPWAGYRVQRYSLEGVELLGVRVGDSIVDRIPVSRLTDRPALVGQPVRDIVSVEALPVYARMPALSLPVGSWRVALLGPDRTVVRDVDVGGGVRTVDLADLWADRPFGRFEVVARSTLGRDARPSAFAVVPGLGAATPDGVLAPGAGVVEIPMAADAPITLHPPTLELGPGETAGDAWAWLGRDAKVGLIVRVPRLRWAIRWGDRDPVLGVETVAVTPDQVGQDAEALIVDTGRAGRTLEVRLATGDGTNQLVRSRPSGPDGRLIINLAVFRETARTATRGFRLTVAVDAVSVVVAQDQVAIGPVRSVVPPVGTEVTVRVTAVSPFAVRVAADGWTGKIFADRLPQPVEAYSIGEEVTAWVIAFDGDHARLDAKPFNPKRFALGEAVSGTVQKLSHDRAWVDVSGYRAYLPEERAQGGLSSFWVGRQIEARVVEVNRDSRLLGLSTRPLIGSEFAVGTVVTGSVVRFSGDRLWVDLGTATGLIRRGETEDGRSIESYRRGEQVTASIARVDEERQVVELTARAWLPGVVVGQALTGTVLRVVRGVVLVVLRPGIVGGIPTRKLPPHMVADPLAYVSVGGRIPVRVEWIDTTAHRIGLVADFDHFTFGEDEQTPESPFAVLRDRESR